MPILPTPAAARYSAAGEPRPPAPMSRTLAAMSLRWPMEPTSGRMMWRAYRRAWSRDKAGPRTIPFVVPLVEVTWFSIGQCSVVSLLERRGSWQHSRFTMGANLKLLLQEVLNGGLIEYP